jgi:hypothetical protein
VWRLTGPYDIDGGQMREAIERTAAHRRVEFRPLSEVVVTLPKRRAGTYAAWRGRQSVDGQAYPQTFAEVVKSVIAFADPLLQPHPPSSTWSHRTRSWS